MKKPIKALIVLVATLCISTSAMSTQVYARTFNTRQKAEYAGQYLNYAIQLIMTEYTGSDVTVEELYEAALSGMTGILDPYSTYFTEAELKEFIDSLSGEIVLVGIILDENEEGKVYIKQVLDSSAAQAAGLKEGDIITSINGIDVAGMSVDAVLLLVQDGSEIDLEVLRDGAKLSFTVTKSLLHVNTVYVENIENILPETASNDNSKIRYIYIETIGDQTDEEFQGYLEQMLEEGVTSVILDLRGNTGGYLDTILSISSELVPEGPIMYTVGNDGKQIYESELKKCPFEQIVVLTDCLTASASEVLTAALQDSGAAKVVGRTTYGKGVIQQIEPLPPGGALKLTIEEYFSRNGTKIDGIGITPDIIVDQPDYILDYIVLDNGNAGEGVPNLKKILSFLGYETGEMNDIYDDATREALMAFQTSHNLPGNGILNDVTLSSLNTELSKKIIEDDQILKRAYELVKE